MSTGRLRAAGPRLHDGQPSPRLPPATAGQALHAGLRQQPFVTHAVYWIGVAVALLHLVMNYTTWFSTQWQATLHYVGLGIDVRAALPAARTSRAAQFARDADRRPAVRHGRVGRGRSGRDGRRRDLCPRREHDRLGDGPGAGHHPRRHRVDPPHHRPGHPDPDRDLAHLRQPGGATRSTTSSASPACRWRPCCSAASTATTRCSAASPRSRSPSSSCSSCSAPSWCAPAPATSSSPCPAPWPGA